MDIHPVIPILKHQFKEDGYGVITFEDFTGICEIYEFLPYLFYSPELVKSISFNVAPERRYSHGSSNLCTIGGFYPFKNLEEISVPNSEIHLAYSACKGCENLTEIILPETITKIGHSAFKGCVNLVKIVIPNSVAKICSAAFAECVNLVDITITSVFERIDPQDGFFRFCGLFRGCKSLKNISLPNGISEIGGYDFSECECLTDIDIPDSVTRIGMSAFENCKSLQQISLPNGIKEIEGNAFRGCVLLWDVRYRGDYKTVKTSQILFDDTPYKDKFHELVGSIENVDEQDDFSFN